MTLRSSSAAVDPLDVRTLMELNPLPPAAALARLRLPLPDLSYVSAQDDAKKIDMLKPPSGPVPMGAPVGPPMGPPVGAPMALPMGNPMALGPGPIADLSTLNPAAKTAIIDYIKEFEEIKRTSQIEVFRSVCDERIFHQPGATLKLEKDYEEANVKMRKAVDERCGISRDIEPFLQDLRLSGLPISNPGRLAQLRAVLTRHNHDFVRRPFPRQLKAGAVRGPDGLYPPDAYGAEEVTLECLTDWSGRLYPRTAARLPNIPENQAALTAFREREGLRTRLTRVELDFRHHSDLNVSFNGVVTVTAAGQRYTMDGRQTPIVMPALGVWHVPGTPNYIRSVQDSYANANQRINAAFDGLRGRLLAAGVAPDQIDAVLRSVRQRQPDPPETFYYRPRF